MDAKYICESRSAVVAEGAEYKILALLIEDQYAGEHLNYGIGDRRCSVENAGRAPGVGKLDVENIAVWTNPLTNESFPLTIGPRFEARFFTVSKHSSRLSNYKDLCIYFAFSIAKVRSRICQLFQQYTMVVGHDDKNTDLTQNGIQYNLLAVHERGIGHDPKK